eukprot:m51a1_g4247 hypothetical protein (830) ;mRNA; r:197586-200383
MPRQFENVVKQIQSAQSQIEHAQSTRLLTPAWHAFTFRGSSLLAFLAQSPRSAAEAASIAQSLLDRGVIEDASSSHRQRAPIFYSSRYYLFLPDCRELTEKQVEELSSALREAQIAKDWRVKGATYNGFFTGADAITTWQGACRPFVATRQDGIHVGQELLNRGVLAAVPGTRSEFKDNGSLYTFRTRRYVHTGYLLKRGQDQHEYRPRWFCLREFGDPNLYYYASPSSPRPTNSVVLEGSVASPALDGANSLRIVTTTRVFSLQAATPAALQEWSTVLMPVLSQGARDDAPIDEAESVIAEAEAIKSEQFLCGRGAPKSIVSPRLARALGLTGYSSSGSLSDAESSPRECRRQAGSSGLRESSRALRPDAMMSLSLSLSPLHDPARPPSIDRVSWSDDESTALSPPRPPSVVAADEQLQQLQLLSSTVPNGVAMTAPAPPRSCSPPAMSPFTSPEPDKPQQQQQQQQQQQAAMAGAPQPRTVQLVDAYRCARRYEAGHGRPSRVAEASGCLWVGTDAGAVVAVCLDSQASPPVRPRAQAHSTPIVSIVSVSNGAFVLSGDQRGGVAVWDATTARGSEDDSESPPLALLRAREGTPAVLCAAGDDVLVPSPTPGAIDVWYARRATRRGVVEIAQCASPIRVVACSPDAELVVAWSEEGDAYFVRWPAGDLVCYARAVQDIVAGPAVSASLVLAGVGEWAVLSGHSQGAVCLWQLSHDEESGVLRPSRLGSARGSHEGLAVRDVALLGSGLAWSASGVEICEWRVGAGSLSAERLLACEPGASPRCLSTRAPGRPPGFFMGADDGAVYLWEPVRESPAGSPGPDLPTPRF